MSGPQLEVARGGAQRERSRLAAAAEVRRLGEDLREPGDLIVERHVLAEHHQEDLVVAAGGVAGGVHHDRRVVRVAIGAFLRPPVRLGEGAEHERGVEPAPHHPAVVGREVVRERARQRVRVRRLRPDDQLGAGALQLGRGALVQNQESRELRRIPLLDDADVGLHQARAHLGRGRTARVGLVHPQRAVAEVGDDQHGHRHQRAPGGPAAARGGEERVRDGTGEGQHERGDAERPGHVGDLDDRRHERLRDRQVVGKDLRHQELDGDHDQRRQQHERRTGPVPGPPHAPGEEARTPAPGRR